MIERDEIKGTLLKVSDCMMKLDEQGVTERFPVSLLDMRCWEWPQGVGLLGLVRYALAEKDEAILSFLEQWYDAHLPAIDSIERNVNSTCPMLALTYLYAVRPKPAYYDLIVRWADWIMDPGGLIRTGDGCFQHMITGDPNADELLIDTLFMTVLFLVRAGNLLGRDDMLSEANYQVLAHIKYLYDTSCGLFYHGWSFAGMGNYGKVHWLRGNGWYTVGCIDILTEQKELPEEVRRVIVATLTRQADALGKYQDEETGLWHTIIENPASYIELSGSCASLCGIMKAIRMGLLPHSDYIGIVRKGFHQVFRYITEQGAVTNVSYGTPIGLDEQHYLDIPCYTMTYGQAMMILLLQESMHQYWKDKL